MFSNSHILGALLANGIAGQCKARWVRSKSRQCRASESASRMNTMQGNARLHIHAMGVCCRVAEGKVASAIHWWLKLTASCWWPFHSRRLASGCEWTVFISFDAHMHWIAYAQVIRSARCPVLAASIQHSPTRACRHSNTCKKASKQVVASGRDS